MFFLENLLIRWLAGFYVRAMNTPHSATGASFVLKKLLNSPMNAFYSRLFLFCIFNPANELIMSDGRQAFPERYGDTISIRRPGGGSKKDQCSTRCRAFARYSQGQAICGETNLPLNPSVILRTTPAILGAAVDNDKYRRYIGHQMKRGYGKYR